MFRACGGPCRRIGVEDIKEEVAVFEANHCARACVGECSGGWVG